MPKVTFFNLPDEKKATLIAAAKMEFSRVPLSDASISNIVKTAKIPRGSFYQYFEDKEDAFFFLLNELAKEKKQSFLASLQKNEGDLFETMVELFQVFIQDEENTNFMNHAFLNMTYKIESTLSKVVSDTAINERFKEISSFVDKNKLNISDDKELFHVYQIITSVTFRNFIEKFAHNIPYQKAMENYMIEINLLKKGLCRS